MRPTARVLALLELLQDGGTRTVADLAQRLAVDERTVRRYVEHLRDLDVAVDSVRGRYGGYRLGPHTRMPPLMLSEEESLAVVWALWLAGRATSGPISTLAAQTAIAKVRRVLPAAVAQRIATLLETIDVRVPDDEDDLGAAPPNAPGEKVLFAVADAVRNRRQLAFGYISRQNRVTLRRVAPYGLVEHHAQLYLTGFDFERGEARTFRADRMFDARVLDDTIVVPADADPVQQVLGPLSASPHRHAVSVRIHTDVAHVHAHIPHMLASVTPLPSSAAGEGWVRVFLNAERLEWVARRLAVIDRPFVVEYPKALRDAVIDVGKRLIAAAGSAGDAESVP